MEKTFYWIAINRNSCAICQIPSAEIPTVSPVPEQIIGFPTLQEAAHAQSLILTAPIEKVNKYMTREVSRRVRAGELRYRRPANPEPPTGRTVWGWEPTETPPEEFAADGQHKHRINLN